MASAQPQVLLDKKSSVVDKYKPEIAEDGWVYFSKRPAIKEFVVNLLQDKSSLGLNEGDILVTKNGIQLLKHVIVTNSTGKWVEKLIVKH